MKLDQILLEWQKDKIVDEAVPHKALVEIPILHGKYLEILSQHRLSAQRQKFEHSKMKKIRREYYLGALDKETLDQYGWDQFDLRIGTKGNIDYYLEADDYLIKILEKKAYYDECVFICESIMKELNSRTFQIREFLIHSRWLQGSN